MSARVTEIRDDGSLAEARELSEWLHDQAALYEKHAPALKFDIQRFRDAAALLDAFQAGLVPVTFHPLMRMEVVRWTRTSTQMPDDGETVLLVHADDDVPWPGYLDGDTWRSADGMPMGLAVVTDWAAMPVGPQPDPAREEDASCA